MVGAKEEKRTHNRSSLKTHVSFNNYPKWKDKLRENCLKRVRKDRTRLIWKLRLSDIKDHSVHHQDIMKSSFQDIVAEELRRIKDSSGDENFEDSTVIQANYNDDAIWEYDGLHTAYQGDCEEILLEMQSIFYEDLMREETKKESETLSRCWNDEEDEYLSQAVYEHMQLNGVQKEVWCPVCKQGELQENNHFIICTLCQLKLDRGDEINLDLLRTRLAEAHTEHLDRGCRLRPEFCMESKFQLTALYIKCPGCATFEVVI